MKLITENEIIVVGGDRPMDEQFSAVTAETQKKLDAAKEKAKKVGYFSKERKERRQEDRAVKKTERIEARTTKIEDRIAKKGARPLQATVVGGVKKFKDKLPKVFKKSDGSGYEKVDPATGKKSDVPAENLAKMALPEDPAFKPSAAKPKQDKEILVDKTDAAGKGVSLEKVNGETVATTTHNENETVQAPDDNGSIQTYKAADVETKPEGMSTTTKVLIGVGVVSVLGLIIYLVKRGK